jgi:hypothetical protein
MLHYKIEGLKELMDKASPRILAAPMKRFFERSGITIQSKARENAPVDFGQLRGDLLYEVDNKGKEGVSQFVKIGVLKASPGSSMFKKASAMEFGTGLFAEGPNAKGGRHFPPGAALQRWAELHGFQSGWQVAQIIGKRGGLKPRRYLRNAFKDSVNEIKGFLDVLRQEIKQAWDK